ncbi:CoA-binding protein [Caldicellulosiruptor morganii]|uniref:CoA-binding protein n=1 Tax=Caldicellulosiruptor morganii TaxID=1387555 RepID=A0ABY7BSM0_9FIRM|nr:CoA-binding protein [Caldicellulosiruptor morganii]WAM34761.1 CoA-binding protein [Caldicellulosiruptor morganii]
MQHIEEALKLKNWAVVGATPNKQKYGYLVFKKLVESGYNVFPVNPFYEVLDGYKVYRNINEISDKIDCISMIVAPEKGEKYILEAASKNVKYIWFQPGAENAKLVDMCKELDIVPIYNACILVALNSLKK